MQRQLHELLGLIYIQAPDSTLLLNAIDLPWLTYQRQYQAISDGCIAEACNGTNGTTRDGWVCQCRRGIMSVSRPLKLPASGTGLEILEVLDTHR